MRKKEPLNVRLNLVDRLIGQFSPQATARRYAARIAIGNMERAYDGAKKGRTTDGWKTASGSADSEIAPSAALLRDRMRDLVRNNPTAARAVSVLVNNMVGTGIRPRAAGKSKAANRKVDALFEAWSQVCDADGHTDFYGQQALAIRSMIEGGDTFAMRRRRRPSDGLPVPLQIQLMEVDHLDASKNDDRGNTRVRQGIEYDAIGRRVAYWLYRDHPGDNLPMLSRRFESERVEASRIAHVFERQRLQSRGVPWGTPALRALRDVDDWQAAELVRKKTEACLVGVVLGADEDQQSIAPTVEDSEGNVIEQFEPGMIAYARGGKDIKFNSPASTAGVYEWHSVMLHIVAAGFRVPYELLQNSDDAGSTVVTITELGDRTWSWANNGRPLTSADAEALCRSASSTKRRGGDSIGYRGIGFKSLAAIASRIHGWATRMARHARTRARTLERQPSWSMPSGSAASR